MSEKVKMETNNNKTDEEQDQTKNRNAGTTINRRDVLKSLTTLPVLGGFTYSVLQKKKYESAKASTNDIFGFKKEKQVTKPRLQTNNSSDLIRIGIIGFGGRGEYLTRGLGFAHPDWMKKKKEEAEQNRLNTNLKDFLEQENLNVQITGICDVYDIRAERGLEISKSLAGPGGNGLKELQGAKRYHHYQDLLQSKDIDAVIVATPDHWHAQMTIDSMKAGKHVYQEKCLTKTYQEATDVYNAVKNSKIVFQLGHQNHQISSHIKAKEIIKRNLLGKISVVEGSTNRFREGLTSIDNRATPETLDWEQFQGPAPNRIPFSAEKYFNWRNYWDYGTGLFGDLLSHEYAAINQILGCGIPKTAMCSGGIYLWGRRETPDVFSVIFEYPDKKTTVVYSLTMGNSYNRGRYFMGTDGVMEVGRDITIHIEPDSEKFKNEIKSSMLDPSKPIKYSQGKFDAVTSATESYFANKGLYYTYVDGKFVDATYLHLMDWLNCIRFGGQPKCHIDLGFEEAITCQMALKSYLEKRMIEWDPVRKVIV